MEDLKVHLINETRELFKEEGLNLVELVIRGSSRIPLIQFYVDHQKGISVDQCARLSREISNILDSMENDNLKSYRLEVSSPGLDRPLKTVSDFQKNIGKKVIMTVQENDQLRKLEGTILGTDRDNVLIENNNERESIILSSIIKAIIKLRW